MTTDQTKTAEKLRPTSASSKRSRKVDLPLGTGDRDRRVVMPLRQFDGQPLIAERRAGHRQRRRRGVFLVEGDERVALTRQVD